MLPCCSLWFGNFSHLKNFWDIWLLDARWAQTGPSASRDWQVMVMVCPMASLVPPFRPTPHRHLGKSVGIRVAYSHSILPCEHLGIWMHPVDYQNISQSCRLSYISNIFQMFSTRYYISQYEAQVHGAISVLRSPYAYANPYGVPYWRWPLSGAELLAARFWKGLSRNGHESRVPGA